MIRRALENDLNDIIEIVRGTVKDLQAEGNMQWDDKYPSSDDFKRDIQNNSLFVCEEDKEILGFIVVDKKEPEEYKNLEWHSNEFLIIHRFSVSNKHLRKGIGSKLMKFVEVYGKEIGVKCIKVDTNSKNSRMNYLFNKMEYRFVGYVSFRDVKDKFNCYEKILEAK